jgi:hypothetical protein
LHERIGLKNADRHCGEKDQLMELSRVLNRGLAACIAVVGMMSLVPAHAVTIVGKWDPSFGAGFADLGWRGEARFFLPNACLVESGWVLNTDSCSDSGMKILSAEVEFYKVSDPTNAAFQETLLFDVPSSAVDRMRIDSGQLTGVDGSFLYSRSSTLALAGYPYTSFVLFFEGDLAWMSYTSDTPNGVVTGFSDPNPSDGRPVITFSVVPEPGSVPLVLAALLTIGLLVRRHPAKLPR